MKRSLILHAALCLTALTACGTAPQSQNAPLGALHVDGNPPGGLATRGTFGQLALVGEVRVHDAEPDLIADLTGHPGQPYAYLARWGGSQCAGPEKRGQQSPDGGAYVIDLRDPAQPREVGFIPVHQDTLVGEGMQVVNLTTSAYSGDVLLMNHEGCGKNYKAGFSLVDVTNPLKPKRLALHEGDFTTDNLRNRPHTANQYHSAFAWDAGNRAYLVATDDEESLDVDLYDITDPKRPRLIRELDLNAFGVSQPEMGLTDSFLHDMVVKKIGNDFIMLLSYWDGGYVMLNVNDPANPVFLSDTDYGSVDPELLAQAGLSLTPEGNGHQAEFTADNRFVLATDEDFDPYRLQVNTPVGNFRASLGTNTTPDVATALAGPTVFLGQACNGGPALPAGAGRIAVVERGGCFFEDKALNVLSAGGYAGMVIMNREGEDACTGVFGPSLSAAIPTLFIGRDAGFRLFGQTFNLAACLDATPQASGIPVGTAGQPITSVAKQFDGWGYVHLFGRNGSTLTSLDTFAIPEAMNEAFATGHGDLSVHEVATDPTRADVAYLSYYNGGVRALKIDCSAACRLMEVGGYVNNASTFWGIEVWTHPRTGQQYVLASDMNSGLKVFRYTGP